MIGTSQCDCNEVMARKMHNNGCGCCSRRAAAVGMNILSVEVAGVDFEASLNRYRSLLPLRRAPSEAREAAVLASLERQPGPKQSQVDGRSRAQSVSQRAHSRRLVPEPDRVDSSSRSADSDWAARTTASSAARQRPRFLATATRAASASAPAPFGGTDRCARRGPARPGSDRGGSPAPALPFPSPRRRCGPGSGGGAGVRLHHGGQRRGPVAAGAAVGKP